MGQQDPTPLSKFKQKQNHWEGSSNRHCLPNSSQRWVVSPHPAAQVLPGTRGCACWQSPHRRRIAGLEALAGLVHLTASGESEWDCPSCHPGIFQDRGRLRPPAVITQKSDHRARNSNRLCLHGYQWQRWVRWRTVPSGCFPGEQEAVAAGWGQAEEAPLGWKLVPSPVWWSWVEESYFSQASWLQPLLGLWRWCLSTLGPKAYTGPLGLESCPHKTIWVVLCLSFEAQWVGWGVWLGVSPILSLAFVPVEKISLIHPFVCWRESPGSPLNPDRPVPSLAPLCSLCPTAALMDLDVVSCQIRIH